jgi:uncharacterized protein (DUF433 family)
MIVEDYFDLNDADGGRIKGHRIWFNDLLYEIVNNHLNAEQLFERFPTLNMEKIYAFLLYFERNKAALTKQLEEDLGRQRRNHEAHAEEGRAWMAELRRRVADASPQKGGA